MTQTLMAIGLVAGSLGWLLWRALRRPRGGSCDRCPHRR